MASELASDGLKKTNAKQKYLKRKKERRKHRLKTKKPSVADLDESGDSGEEDDQEIDDNSLDISEHPEQRPRKRPRVTEESLTNIETVEAESFEDALDTANRKAGDAKEGNITQSDLTTLPSFSLPVLPDAPSKSVLALQGLDENLIDAEIVSSAHVMPIPTSGDDGGTRLSERTRRRLKDLGITELFAVQTTLLPYLIPNDRLSRGLYRPFNQPCDVCISAPTGSGKTLAYVLPIIEVLSSRVVTRLRALVVLPTRDLVAQVRETFEALNKGHGLKIGTATGQHSFVQEQSQLVYESTSSTQGGCSKVDILICTPGRLMDHLNGTPNFSLQHLRFLVVDEADRLLAQSFQDWLAQVLSATRSSKKGDYNVGAAWPGSYHGSRFHCSLPRPDGLSPSCLQRLAYPSIPTFLNEDKESSCQKLLFSATLTRDPGKIAALNLRDPKYFIVQGGGNGSAQSNIMNVALEKFALPDSLKEHMIVSDSTKKPLMMFHLVIAYSVTNALVFTKSAESTTRLVQLFEFFEQARLNASPSPNAQPIIARSYSSDLPPGERKSILEDFKAQKIQILVCSDLISRGIDINHVSHVVSYDAPVDMRKYVHRVGRTARAGREGDAWTLVEEQEARHFKLMLKEADHLDSVKRLRISEKETGSLAPYYESALNKLREIYARQA